LAVFEGGGWAITWIDRKRLQAVVTTSEQSLILRRWKKAPGHVIEALRALGARTPAIGWIALAEGVDPHGGKAPRTVVMVFWPPEADRELRDGDAGIRDAIVPLLERGRVLDIIRGQPAVPEQAKGGGPHAWVVFSR